MTLNDELKTTVIKDLEGQFNISNLDKYVSENGKTLNFLYNKGIIDDTSIEGVLEKVVIREARSDFLLMINNKRPYVIYPDHLLRPECLAYALDKGKFSKEEIEQIPFDHGDTAKIFVQRYNKENLIKELAIGIKEKANIIIGSGPAE